MERALILRGALAGAVGGFLAFVFARIFAEPQISAAINYESGRDAAQNALDKAAGQAVPAMGPDIFSRTIQANVGIGVGMVFFGVAMGLLFAVTYTICLGRAGGVRARTLALLVAGGGLLSMYVVPFLKYPANPPAIGHEDTIRSRSVLYLTMTLAAVLLLIGAVLLGRWLQARLGTWNAALAAGAAYVVAVGIVMALLPSLGELAANVHTFGRHATETPLPLRDPQGRIVYPGFPADTLATFRIYSLLAQVILWGAIGLVFAPLAERVLAPLSSPEAARRDAAPASLR
ncbi:CbtA family protein [Allobranchiibius sp. CTAmp26]|uniref:CbtA family protein n=1 Tax=Allobranchiibius sp. CTAmp26 TaxID=2815214 RepID=UPI001AA0ECAF|nr:CbtA family protein [Allobranchiibius sp. CTAmp26]MBO1753873.1 CbtA family protein [Allobranchiibius sp. CTAmp26]